jgi:hypothetical protein
VSEEALRQVDRYEILACLGEGGMAAVYYARFEATGGASKQVALKLIHPHLSQEPAFVQMFLNEMRVAMAMSHRNIVQTFDAGKYRDRYYLVMELMNRGSLSKVSDLPVDVAVLVAMEVCAGLDYAHSFRDEPVIHRDVSPANILLSDQGDVKLADFGVAKVSGQLSGTITGVVKGKLRYMAPEQARGEADPRSDIFALGAVLYSMVAGVPLRPNPSLEQARLGVERVEFPPERAGAIPRGLQRLIARCLHRDPEQRPASAAELRELLARELGGIRQGGDPLARLRGFFAPLPSTVPEPEPTGQARRLTEAVMQVALGVPAKVELEEASTVAAGGTTGPELPDDARTAETSVSPIRAARIDEVGTVETAPTRERRRLRRLWLASAAVLGAALALAAVLWATRPLAPAPVAEHVVVADAAPGRADLAPRSRDAAPRPLDASRTEPDAASRRDLSENSGRAEDGAAERPNRPRRAPAGGFGQLDLNSSPWARVYIDGRLAGETPLQGLRLRAGRHAVRLVNDERRLSAQLTVQVLAGRTTRRWIRLGAPVTP